MPEVQPPEPTGIYGLNEALRDALSGPLVHVGTGPWTGNARVKACAYHNDRVLVVNIEGAISVAAARQLSRALDQAKKENAAAIVMRLDTPGALTRRHLSCLQLPYIGKRLANSRDTSTAVRCRRWT